MDSTTGASRYLPIALISLFFAAFVAFVAVYAFRNCRNMKEAFGVMDKLIANVHKAGGSQKAAMKEGFGGPAVGAGMPNCMNTSKDAAALYELLNKHTSTTEEGPDDLREMQVILSKIACFKRDLLSTASVVEATRYQPFSTSHDLEPVAETTARCFAKTIPQRDLSLGLDKWGTRGTFLLKRLCTSERLTELEEHEALQLFGDAMADITEIALGKCCNSDVGVIAGQPQPRMVGGYETPTVGNLKEYKGYY
jgi:hypothetical protein